MQRWWQCQTYMYVYGRDDNVSKTGHTRNTQVTQHLFCLFFFSLHHVVSGIATHVAAYSSILMQKGFFHFLSCLHTALPLSHSYGNSSKYNVLNQMSIAERLSHICLKTPLLAMYLHVAFYFQKCIGKNISCMLLLQTQCSLIVHVNIVDVNQYWLTFDL